MGYIPCYSGSKGCITLTLEIDGNYTLPKFRMERMDTFFGGSTVPHELSDVQQMHGKIRQAIMAIKSSKIFVRLQILPSANDFGHEYGDVWSVW